MSYQVTRESFLKDVSQHVMTIDRDDGLYRDILFSRPETRMESFRLTTWPGYLCISGDMGCYVFSRLRDMFDFFGSKDEELSINRGYWAEKVQAACRHGGVTEYSPDKFRKVVNEWVDDWCSGMQQSDGEQANALREAVMDEVLSHADDGEVRARDAADSFDHEGLAFTDFWETNLTEYTSGYTWCCFAIVWGIRQYRLSKEVAVS